jgi:hypothetical protein
VRLDHLHLELFAHVVEPADHAGNDAFFNCTCTDEPMICTCAPGMP